MRFSTNKDRPDIEPLGNEFPGYYITKNDIVLYKMPDGNMKVVPQHLYKNWHFTWLINKDGHPVQRAIHALTPYFKRMLSKGGKRGSKQAALTKASIKGIKRKGFLE